MKRVTAVLLLLLLLLCSVLPAAAEEAQTVPNAPYMQAQELADLLGVPLDNGFPDYVAEDAEPMRAYMLIAPNCEIAVDGYGIWQVSKAGIVKPLPRYLEEWKKMITDSSYGRITFTDDPLCADILFLAKIAYKPKGTYKDNYGKLYTGYSCELTLSAKRTASFATESKSDTNEPRWQVGGVNKTDSIFWMPPPAFWSKVDALVESILGWYGEERVPVPTLEPGATPAPKPVPLSSLSSAAVGMQVTFGRYVKGVQKGAPREPIEWDVIDVNEEENSVLLFSRKILDQQKYRPEYKDPSTWQISKIRHWLNTVFLDEAFTDDEQERILIADVPAGINPDYGTDPGPDTKDKLFLLSIGEVSRLPAGTELIGSLTKYAAGREKDTKKKEVLYWGLRSPGDKEYAMAIVKEDGTIYSSGYMSSSYVGVRPAMWVRLGDAPGSGTLYTDTASLAEQLGVTRDKKTGLPLYTPKDPQRLTVYMAADPACEIAINKQGLFSLSDLGLRYSFCKELELWQDAIGKSAGGLISFTDDPDRADIVLSILVSYPKFREEREKDGTTITWYKCKVTLQAKQLTGKKTAKAEKTAQRTYYSILSAPGMIWPDIPDPQDGRELDRFVDTVLSWYRLKRPKK